MVELACYKFMFVICTSLFQILSTSFCGTDQEVEIVSPDNSVHINFFADTSVNGRGFDITYKAVDNGMS